MADNRELDLSTLSTQQLDGLKKSLEKVRTAAAERRGERRVACGAARAGAPGASRLRRSAPPPAARITILRPAQDVEALMGNFQQLKEAQERFAESAASLAGIPADGAGREVMVPLTSSLYVPGTLAGTEEVLVDIGTGFYVGASRARSARVPARLACARAAGPVPPCVDRLTALRPALAPPPCLCCACCARVQANPPRRPWRCSPKRPPGSRPTPSRS